MTDFKMIETDEVPPQRVSYGTYVTLINRFLKMPASMVYLEEDQTKVSLSALYQGLRIAILKLNVSIDVSLRTDEGRVYLFKEGRQK